MSTPRTGRRRLAAAAGLSTLAAAALVGVGGPAHAARSHGADFTWTGAADAAGGSNEWSVGGNWAGGVAPAAGSSISLAFPALACVSAGTCDNPFDDISGLTLTALTITSPGSDGSGDGYTLSGNGYTLAGPFLSTADTSTGTSLPLLFLFQPVTLAGTSATWTLDQAQAVVAGGTTGTAALKVSLTNGGFLSLNADNEIGSTSIAGPGGKAGRSGGFAIFGNLDSTNGNKVSARDTFFFAFGQGSGPLALTDVATQLGGGGDNHDNGSFPVQGAVGMDKKSSTYVTAFQNGTGGAQPAAGSDYPVLSATGAVKLAGSLQPYVDCDAPVGFSYPFVQGGKVSGSFTDSSGTAIRSGSTLVADGPGCSPVVRIDYTKTAVTLTVVSAGAGATGARAATRVHAAPPAAPSAGPSATTIRVAGRSVQALAR